MTPLSDRQQSIEWINEAVVAGARREAACDILQLSIRTVQRWMEEGKLQADKRPSAERPMPANALSDAERGEILAICNQPEFASLPPSQIVPRLADQGRYLASESTFYRVLRAANQQHHRGRSQTPRHHARPATHIARQANSVWSWDITYLPSPVRGQYYYLYLISDVYSRKAVGWEVHAEESGALAADLLQRTVIREQCLRQPLVLHSDNGAPMKSTTMLSKMYELGVTPSRGRPRVSNDNPYAEALFRTLKYCPQWPSDGFASLDEARGWVRDFLRWYNAEHRHSRIRFVTPNERHKGLDKGILQRRHALYQQAKQQRPERWSGMTRNWSQVGAVALNPEREILLRQEAA